MNDMVFEGKVDESEVGKIKEGMVLDLMIGAIEDKKFKAVLEFISPKGVIEEGAIKFEIRASMKLQSDEFIRAGYSANADIIFDSRDSVLAIKESLLQFSGDSVFVEVETKPYVADSSFAGKLKSIFSSDKKGKESGFFEKRLIKTGISDGINIEVISGVSKGEKIKIAQVTGDVPIGVSVKK
jgi:HlyD family secretion protein